MYRIFGGSRHSPARIFTESRRSRSLQRILGMRRSRTPPIIDANRPILIHLPAAMVAAASAHLLQSSFLVAVVQGRIPLGDSSDPRDPLCRFSRAMAVDVTGAHVPVHRAEDVNIHLEDMRALGTIR
jgi:hypothetical protein